MSSNRCKVYVGIQFLFFDRERQAFQGIKVLLDLLYFNPFRSTLQNKFLQFLRVEGVLDRVWDVSLLCQNCFEFEQRYEEKTLELVRQRVLDLYPQIFEFQVWNLESGRPVPEEAFFKLEDPFFMYHVSAAVKFGVTKTRRERSFLTIALVNLMWCLVPSANLIQPIRDETNVVLEMRKFKKIVHFLCPSFPYIGNAAVEFLNRICGEGKSLASDQTFCVYHEDQFKLCKFHLNRRQDLKWFITDNVKHYAFLENSNTLLYYTSAQSLQIMYPKTGTELRSVTGGSPFLHPSKNQIVYWFVELNSEIFNFLRDVPKDLRQFLLPLTLERDVNGTFISAATVFSLLPELFGTIGEEDISPFVSLKSIVFSQNGGLIAYHLGPKLYICNVFGAFSYLLCEDQWECDSCLLAFSPGSSLLLRCIQNSNDNPRFQVWDVHSRALKVTFDLPAVESLIPPLDCCCLSSDNTKLIVCGGFIIEIWEYGASASRLIARIENHLFISNYNEFTHCTVSLETNLLACCITDRIAICLINTSTDQFIRLLPPAHLGKIEFCQFLKGGRYLISYGVDGNVILWDLNRCEAIAFAKLCQGRESIKSLCRSCEGDKFLYLTYSGRFGVITLCGLEHSILPKLPTLEVQSGEMMFEESCGQQREQHGLTLLNHATDDLNVDEFLEEMDFMCDSESNSEDSDHKEMLC